MIDATALLKDLKRLLRALETDIRERVTGTALDAELRADWQAARDAKRTAQAYTAWLDEEVTQAAVHWVLGCVFLRFVEDNGLVDRPWLSGPGERLEMARDRHEAWFRANPTGEERDFLLACFAEAAELPGLGALFDRRHNPLWRLPVSGDGAILLREFWQRRDPDSGVLVHDFTDGDLGTRFLGDLYQDLSEAARKRFALLQTPEFVEEFILDRTLDPAVREFGFREVRLIDPTCGSGHFLLGAFRRLFGLWSLHEPTRNPRDSAQKALDAVCGVDINPFAAAIAHFRLLIAALTACGIASLRGAPDFRVSVAVGDSLLHGKRFMEVRGWQMSLMPEDGLAHVYHEEDREALDLILGRQYHAVVGNPPYIIVKDKALNLAYRERYSACHMKYSLGVPFTQRFWDLAITKGENSESGFVGVITANSFMKREFGKKLIESFLPKIDLTAVIDTAGAYIPGHGTPTVILFGRNQKPVASQVRAAMGIKGEPGTPEDPSLGLVWSSIVNGIDQAGTEDAFISIADLPRDGLAKHPWSMGGGGASDLKEAIEKSSRQSLDSISEEIGISAVTGEDDAYIAEHDNELKRLGVKSIHKMIVGDAVRDWNAPLCAAIWPFDENLKVLPPSDVSDLLRYLWSYRRRLLTRKRFGTLMVDRGLSWYEFQELYPAKLKSPLTITVGEVSTHNHFSLNRGGVVFNRTAPVIKLSPKFTEVDHIAITGVLNSSTSCFWLKQVCHNKGSTVDQKGARQRTDPFEDFYQFNATKLQSFPLAEAYPTDLATALDGLARELTAALPKAVIARALPTRADLDAAKARARSIRRRLIALQEELDFRCYRLYGLLEEDAEHPAPPEVDLGERAFEIVMARKMADGELETTWFDRHGSTPVTDIPAHWPADYRALVERRIALIEDNRWIGLVERPEYKRRWQWDDQGFDAGWAKREQAALKDWLLDRLEDGRYWSRDPALLPVSRLADMARRDADFMAMAELYTGRPDFQVAPLVAELVAAESVPFLPVLRYSEDGLRKRRAWEETWELQRREDAIDARTGLPQGDPNRLTPEQAKEMKAREVGDIPVPPKYRTPDFQKTDYWRLRGGLDVPKERFVSYPFAERDADGSLMVAWAGYDHLQQATALAAHYLAMKENEGWSADRLIPLLAGVQELVPWLLQWHNDYNPDFGVGLGSYYRDFVADEARALGLTIDDLRSWTPPARATARRGRRKAS
ncbi:BREX-2 system adenine-specific DNA-methyltransferase PglX (plasmid) [Azospirillum oryzae]|uniref:site-specific DNA-methyltransferase (adenine-specific) n=1 Tax=Azospirillum oryzae TaxID=286727 RepID=A0A6N1ASI4_9PROT|nr:BREX-2 system adenine-specific DNA-methyltransferase PglX [Azospirillum oryzae]KAA0584860.1 BREX-2 system adenine-specific DNA-methyltransferase PglX [Azospirillum oryzae]QKS54339.1 BREX-2 system adenine-specific DNA-methyltransferase PglX [Azospirillum oryzae]GLR78913.1 DNA methylase [Azospirillum oryzae]